MSDDRSPSEPEDPGRSKTRLASATRDGTTSDASERTASIPPGTLLSHTYEIVALVARGGMGEVYRARHVDLGTEHAIKIILPEMAENPKVVDMFRREASVLRQVRHPAIVGYDGVFRDEHGRVYLVMEFVDGPSLGELIKRGPLGAGASSRTARSDRPRAR